ncbi:ribokinase-like [Saccoglossus kowalevskii]|uniref:Ribokinase n=1 Tax=Saccoglossus kowalevskii TaxID=10224 RepID=A0ABM0GYW3_SACKO|nr:PREDICTED: ribokinase-like [Saccoglossus kowalevskii]
MAAVDNAVNIAIVGSCNTDLISYVPRLPKPGETIHGTKFSVGFGGKGANQCVMAARLGVKVAMVSKVGDDSFGHDTIKNFQTNNVNTNHVSMTKEAATGVAPITVNTEGQNSIVIVSGANMLITEDDAKSALSQMPDLKVVICQLEISPHTSLAAMKYAKEKGILTIFNPAPAIPELDSQFYKYADIFCPNETETELLTGLPVTNITEAEKAALALLDKGCSKVVITLGTQGSVVVTSETRKAIHIPTNKVKAIDTTGAGDAFIGSLAYYLAHYPALPLEECIKRASHIASVSVCGAGTQTSFPWKKDLPSELF